MRVTRLHLANLRAIEFAEFSFKTGLNLIVGVNGVGKSTILDAIRICMSRVLPSISNSRSRAMSFVVDDIRAGFPFLDVSLDANLGDKEFRLTRRQWKTKFAADDEENIERLRREILESERLRDRARNLLRDLEDSHGVSDSDTLFPGKGELSRTARALKMAPNCVFFATNRSVVAGAKAPKSKTSGGRAAAYAEALVSRPWQVRQFAEWMRTQSTLAAELPVAARHLEVLQVSATRFLPSCQNIRHNEDASSLLIDSHGTTLDVSQLSDGERGVLGMVLDLAKRLSQANPNLDDPLQEGEAVVLIDELDLHLHPSWQRQIVHKLTTTFPRCQFIATTHSPQVIGEVEHDHIQIISKGEVYSPPHSFGVDSSRVLEEIMGADPRTQKVDVLLSQVSHEVSNQRYESARELLAQLVDRLGENDPEVTRIRTLLDFMEGEE